MEENRRKRTKLIITAVAIVLIVTAIAVIIYLLGSSGRALKKQLDLGHKYLIEQEYEQAIVCFRKAIEIDPMCEEAYVGAVDAYVAIKDIDSAILLLEDAIDLFESKGLDATVLKDMLIEIQKAKENEEAKKKVEGEKQFLEMMGNLQEEVLYARAGTKSGHHGDVCTWEQRKAICHPLIEKLIKCVEFCENENIDYITNGGNEKYYLKQMYEDCECLYVRCNEMEECYALRKRRAEKLDIPDILVDGYSESYSEGGIDGVKICDKYGRITEMFYTNDFGMEMHDIYTYYAGSLNASVENYTKDMRVLKTTFRYDEDGRLIGRTEDIGSDEGSDTSEYSYVYSENMVTERWDNDNFPMGGGDVDYTINDYGFAVDMED